MGASYARRISLSDENQFTFTCPIFNAKTKMGACMQLRELVWRGRDTPVRKGCQAAMSCGMCPAAALVSMYAYDRAWDNDFHGSREPKEGRLHAQVLGRILRVVPQDPVLNRYGVSASERDLLYSAQTRIQAQLKTAPGEQPPRASNYDAPAPRKRSAPKPKPAPVDNALNEAARSGDLTAAINA